MNTPLSPFDAEQQKSFAHEERYRLVQIRQRFAESGLSLKTYEHPAATLYFYGHTAAQWTGPFVSELAAQAHAVLPDDEPEVHAPGEFPMPNLLKMNQNRPGIEAVRSFMAFLQKQDIALAVYRERSERFVPHSLPLSDLMAEWVGADNNEATAEASRMVALLAWQGLIRAGEAW